MTGTRIPGEPDGAPYYGGLSRQTTSDTLTYTIPSTSVYGQINGISLPDGADIKPFDFHRELRVPYENGDSGEKEFHFTKVVFRITFGFPFPQTLVTFWPPVPGGNNRYVAGDIIQSWRGLENNRSPEDTLTRYVDW